MEALNRHADHITGIGFALLCVFSYKHIAIFGLKLTTKLAETFSNQLRSILYTNQPLLQRVYRPDGLNSLGLGHEI